MLKVLKYTLYDLLRSRSLLFYFGFYLLFTLGLFWLSADLQKVLVSLMNVVLVLVPLIATMFGVMYYYNSREFTELLLALPLPRRDIFLGQYAGLAGSVNDLIMVFAFAPLVALLLGVGLPFLLYGLAGSALVGQFLVLLGTGVVLTFVFSGIAFFIALRNDNRIRGFGLAILVWLLFAVAYDGALLLALALLRDYPLEKFALGASLFNPIDLSRILIMLKLDVAALMGFTGAVFRKFLGTGLGSMVAVLVLLLWVAGPLGAIRMVAERKDF